VIIIVSIALVVLIIGEVFDENKEEIAFYDLPI